MTVSALILRASRAAHKFAVKTHCKALRLSVLAADAKADLLDREASVAQAAALAAHQITIDTTEKAIAARKHAYEVSVAAFTEANNIGGSL